MIQVNAEFHAATGTPGLDDLLSGGLPAHKPILINMERLHHEIETLENRLESQSDARQFTRRKRLGD